MSTYVGYIIGGQWIGSKRIHTKSAYLLGSQPVSLQPRDLKAELVNVMMTATTLQGRPNVMPKPACLIRGLPTSLEKLGTVIVKKIKKPRMAPLEVAWTRANTD